ncbi:MAG: hypothetical protein ACLQDC_10535, partial [Verrucomicrobiia bacterium]
PYRAGMTPNVRTFMPCHLDPFKRSVADRRWVTSVAAAACGMDPWNVFAGAENYAGIGLV